MHFVRRCPLAVPSSTPPHLLLVVSPLEAMYVVLCELQVSACCPKQPTASAAGAYLLTQAPPLLQASYNEGI